MYGTVPALWTIPPCFYSHDEFVVFQICKELNLFCVFSMLCALICRHFSIFVFALQMLKCFPLSPSLLFSLSHFFTLPWNLLFSVQSITSSLDFIHHFPPLSFIVSSSPLQVSQCVRTGAFCMVKWILSLSSTPDPQGALRSLNLDNCCWHKQCNQLLIQRINPVLLDLFILVSKNKENDIKDPMLFPLESCRNEWYPPGHTWLYGWCNRGR